MRLDRPGRALAGRGTALVAVLAVWVCGVAVHIEPADAEGKIDSFSVFPLTTQAGAHPDLHVSFTLAEPGSPETAETLHLDLPEGFGFIPHWVTRCTAVDFDLTKCPSNSQVGLITIRATPEEEPESLLGTAPVYALLPDEGEFGRLGFVIPVIDESVIVPVTIRSAGDYGARLSIEGLPQPQALAGASLELWGVPAHAANDADRFPPGSPGSPAGCPGLSDTGCNTSTKSNLPMGPFLVNPTACEGSLVATLTLVTHEDPEHETDLAVAYPPVTGCDDLGFDPSLDVALTTEETGSSSGLELELLTPQPQSPTTPTASGVESTTVYFVEGLELGDRPPSSSICTTAEAAIGLEGPSACPESARVGTVTIDLSTVPEALTGRAYFGGVDSAGRYRVLLLASEYGLDMKLSLLLGDDPEFKEVSAEIPRLPQLPITEIGLNLEPSSGLLQTAGLCGLYPIESFVDSWSSLSFEFLDSFSLSSGPGATPCPDPAAVPQQTSAPSAVTPPTTPIPPPSGRAVAARLADVKAGRALLRLRCPRAGHCHGVVKLRVRSKLIGRSRFSISAGRSKVIRVRLNRAGKRLLRKARRHRLRAKLLGRGVAHGPILLRAAGRR